MISGYSDKSGQDKSRWAIYFGLGVLVFLFIFTHRGVQSQNDLSRFVAIGSLINRGTWQLDGAKWAQMRQERGGESYMMMTDVKLHPNGHFYSSKPPVLSFIGAGVSRIFQWLGAQIRFGPDSDGKPTFILTWLIVGSLSALTFYAVRRRTGTKMAEPLASVATLLALGGTLFLSYSTTFNNHTIGAALVLLGCFRAGLMEGDKNPEPRHVFFSGLMMGSALVIDVPAGGAFGLMLGLYLLFYVRSWKHFILFGLGSIPPILLHCALQYSIWGTVLPVQLMGGLGGFEGSYWQNPVGADAWVISRWKYWLLTLFSMRGLFVLSPVLLFGVAGLVDRVKEGLTSGTDTECRKAFGALTATFAIIIMIAYYSLEAPDSFGGSCYGMRWYIGFIPVLSWYAIDYFASHKSDEKVRRLFYLLGLISLTYALIGMQDPWLQMELNPHPAVQILQFIRGF